MKLLSIEAKNFRQYRDMKYTFPTAGLIGIVGENEAGKSTIQEMIGYALYGTDALRTNKDKALSFYAKPDDEYKVILEFIVDGNKYKIERGFNSNSSFGHLWKNDGKKSECDNVSAISTEVKKIFGGMNWSTFKHTYFIRQKELSILSAMRSSERKKFILSMLHIDVIDKALKNIRSDKKDISTKLEMLNADFDLDALEKDLETCRKDFSEKTERRSKLVKVIDKFDNEYSDMKKRYELMNKDLNEIKLQKNTITTNLKNYQDNLIVKTNEKEEIKQKILNLKDIKNNLLDMLNLETKYDELKDKLSKINSIKEKNLRIEKINVKLESLRSDFNKCDTAKKVLMVKISELEDKITDTVDVTDLVNKIIYKIAELNAEVRKNEKEISENSNMIQQFKDEPGKPIKCSKCKTVIENPEHFVEENKNLQIKVDESKQTLKKLNDKLFEKNKLMEDQKKYIEDKKEKNIKFSSIDEKMDDIKQQIEDLRSDLNKEGSVVVIEEAIDELEIKELKTKIDEQKDMRAKVKLLPDYADKLKAVKDTIDDIGRSIEAENNKVDKLRSDIELQKEISELTASIKDIEEKINRSREAKADVDININSIGINIDNLKKEIDKIKDERSKKQELERDLHKTDLLITYFNEFKIDLISKITPRLSELLSSFVLASTRRYSAVELDEEYNIFVTIEDKKQPIEVLSGGADDIFNACLRFSVSRYLDMGSGFKMNMMFVDEIFGSLDPERQKNLLQLLQSFRGFYEQIIVITHSVDIESYFDTIIKVNWDPISKISYLE